VEKAGFGQKLMVQAWSRYIQRVLCPTWWDWTERYHASMKNYYRLITEVDAAFEQIFNELERQKILNETLIIFATNLHLSGPCGGR
jgi:arylsulfatase A-like enzyme